jgi:very-short-patch-repair endonuclease
LTPKGFRMAAVLSSGPAAVLSYGSAIAHRELRPPPNGPIDVTVPGRGRRGPDGVRVHNVRSLDPRDTTVLDGIPITSVPRTLLDYAEVAGTQELRHALDEADRRELLSRKEIDELLARSPGRKGAKPLKAELNKMLGTEPPWTQSELQRAMLALIRERGLPEPRTEVELGDYRVDLYWPEHRLALELDSYEFHRGRKVFRSDRRKDGKLKLVEVDVFRVTEDRIREEPDELLSDLSGLLYGAASGR